MLSDLEAAHRDACGKCEHLVEEYESLKLLVSDSSNPEVPPGFADTVMKRIEMEEEAFSSDWMLGVATFLERLMAVPQAQYAALALGGAAALVNLVRFVFFVLIPS